MTQPAQPSLLKGHPYVHSTHGVNVQETWKRFGWVSPELQRQEKSADQNPQQCANTLPN